MPDTRYVIYRADLSCEKRFLRRTIRQGTVAYAWLENEHATPMLKMQAEAVRDVLIERHGRKGWQFSLVEVEPEEVKDQFAAWLSKEARLGA